MYAVQIPVNVLFCHVFCRTRLYLIRETSWIGARGSYLTQQSGLEKKYWREYVRAENGDQSRAEKMHIELER